MKKKREQWLRMSNRALSGMLALLGFVSCTNDTNGDDPNGGGMLEYGSPYATFEVKGKVIDKKNRTGIPKIEVQMGMERETPEGKKFHPFSDPVLTDDKGEFTITDGGGGAIDYEILAKDIDGEANGVFENEMKDISFKDVKFEGGKGWYRGKATLKDVTIEMENPSAPEEEEQ